MNRSIIVGYENSEQGRDALALGGVLAEALSATPVITTVLRFPHHLLGSHDLEAALRRDTDPVLAEAARRLPGLDVKTQAVIDHSAARALHRLAEGEHPILMVVGSTHRGPLGRVFVGAVGEALLSGAPCGIAVAPRGYAERGDPRPRRIGVALNGAREGWAALAAGISLARRLHASLTLIAVAPPSFEYGAVLSMIGDEKSTTAAEAAMRAVLDKALDNVPDGTSAESLVLHGDPAERIAEAAEHFDLLIVGSRGYGPARRAVLGGVSARLMRLAPCPVLVLPRGAGRDPLGLGTRSVRETLRRSAEKAGRFTPRKTQEPSYDAFDLVALVAPVAGHEVGDRGTVVVAGIGHSLVDFGWTDGPHPSGDGRVNVSHEALRLIERRPSPIPGVNIRKGRFRESSPPSPHVPERRSRR